jgi:26S proteasome regulatory subunit N6
MSDAQFKELLTTAKTLKDNKQDVEAISALEKLIATDGQSNEIIKIKEGAIKSLAELYAKQGKTQQLSSLLVNLRPFFNVITKAKTAKVVRSVIDSLSTVHNAEKEQIALLNESIAWTKQEKRSFLRQRLESRLAACYFKTRDYSASLNLITKLLREVKKLDDKPLLVEIFLLESYVHHAVGHLPKSRAALTTARTAANAIYCSPSLQADLDIQSGTLHAEERDYKTGYSYFYEAFENYTAANSPKAVLCLKYMLLCKIMTNSPEDVSSLINGKLALRYASVELEAMRAIAEAHTKRSLRLFQDTIHKYKSEVDGDPIIHRHLNELYDNLLELNLNKIIEPFSCVEIAHIAGLIELSVPVVEKKLSQMILDKKLAGILDQGNGCLIVFDEQARDEIYPTSLDTVEHLGKVVDSLYSKASKLS